MATPFAVHESGHQLSSRAGARTAWQIHRLCRSPCFTRVLHYLHCVNSFVFKRRRNVPCSNTRPSSSRLSEGVCWLMMPMVTSESFEELLRRASQCIYILIDVDELICKMTRKTCPTRSYDQLLSRNSPTAFPQKPHNFIVQHHYSSYLSIYFILSCQLLITIRHLLPTLSTDGDWVWTVASSFNRKGWMARLIMFKSTAIKTLVVLSRWTWLLLTPMRSLRLLNLLWNADLLMGMCRVRIRLLGPLRRAVETFPTHTTFSLFDLSHRCRHFFPAFATLPRICFEDDPPPFHFKCRSFVVYTGYDSFLLHPWRLSDDRRFL